MRIPILTFMISAMALAQTPLPVADAGRLESMHGKTVMLFTPHPDDDTFCCAGTLYKLAQNGNRIHIVIYTNDDKGSYDPDMTSERLARIRMHEEEEACRVIGIAKDSILWLQYHDGMLEYANPRDLVEQVTGLIRKVRPDVVLSVDPGTDYVRWHKTDHRMAANNTMDAIRAAEWRLYFPNQGLHDGLEPWRVPEEYYYYAGKDANYFVNIDDVVEIKLKAASAHVSQFSPAIEKYRADWDPAALEKLKAELRQIGKRDGHYVEAFRRATGFNEE
jgi:LmbE family N-acetylglucosaminyl deacetylase